MTQKSRLFKGTQKKPAAANRHGKIIKTKKGKYDKGPKSRSSEYLANKEVTKFINSANEAKVAALASKDGGELKIVSTGATDAKAPAKGKKSIIQKK